MGHESDGATEDNTQQPTHRRAISGSNGAAPRPLALRFSGGEFWHRSAPKRVTAGKNGKLSGDLANSWPVWRKHLSARKAPATPRFLRNGASALLWGVPTVWGRQAVADLVREIESLLASRSSNGEFAAEVQSLTNWLAAAAASPTCAKDALVCLAWAYRMPELAARIPGDLWWQAIEQLADTAAQAEHLPADWEGPSQAVVAQQLLAGELPLALAYLFPEIAPLRALRKSASAAFSEGILTVTDGEGMPHARHLEATRALLACWTRARSLAAGMKKDCWSEDAETQYQWLVRQAVCLSRPDGSMAFCPPEETEWPEPLFALALELVGDDADYAAANTLLPAKDLSKQADFDDDDLPESAVNSEWSGVAVLAPNWSPASPRLTVQYDALPLRIELTSGREVLLTGEWSFETTCDGDKVTADGEWETQCWFSDEDCDYLELSLDLTAGVHLERQMLLAREDQILYLADAIVCADAAGADLSHTSRLPLASGMAFHPEHETRDGMLAGARPLAAVMPLALPEWRIDQRFGRLEAAEGSLVLRQRNTGRCLYCPLVLDLRPRRIKKERTWRQLTVAESLEVVPHDVAVGYRVQCAKDQWIFYRSLASPANRTLLGQNVSSEFFAGRFLKTGGVDEFIELQVEE